MKSRHRRMDCCQRTPLESLEQRLLLSAAVSAASTGTKMKAHLTLVHKRMTARPLATSPAGLGLTATQIRHAYGLDQVLFGSVAGDGLGQTIAIIDAYHYPTALADLQAFDAAMGLPDPPSFQQVAQDGSQNFPPTDPAGAGNSNGTWEVEEALDLEWAHAIAPGANIILVEATTTDFSDMIQGGVAWARSQPGVSVISMSFGSTGESSGETTYDSTFTTPAGHNGVTFVAAAGDSGAFRDNSNFIRTVEYPAASPNVVAVGGTKLALSNGNYLSESAWGHGNSSGTQGGGGGGVSSIESQPLYQSAVSQSTAFRTVPDVAMDADPNSGVPIYDSYDFPGSPWQGVYGGTSLASPMFAGVVAVANQGRVLAGLGTLDGPTQTLPMLYSAPASDFHDVNQGSNGYAAALGYDLDTGRGTPVANLVINSLIGTTDSINGTVFSDNNANASFVEGDTALSGVTVYLDQNGNGQLDLGGTQTHSNSTHVSIPDNNTVGALSTVTISGLGGPITNVLLTLNISHQRDNNLSAYLVAPGIASTGILLFSGIGGTSGAGFTSTTFTSAATTSITSGAAPFSGSYLPTDSLAAFNGELANGTWTLVVRDTVNSKTGTLNSWSLTVTTGSESSTVSAADGSYSFAGVPMGGYTVSEVTPAGYLATTSAISRSLFNGSVNADVPNFPVAFTTAGSGDSFYVWVSGAMLNISKNGSNSNPMYQLPVSALSTLAFHLTSANTQLIIDDSGGDPVPAGGLILDGGGLSSSTLRFITPGQTIQMTDTTIGLAGGPMIQYANLGGIAFNDDIVHFTGTLTTLQFLTPGNGTQFYWDG